MTHMVESLLSENPCSDPQYPHKTAGGQVVPIILALGSLNRRVPEFHWPVYSSQ